MEAAEDPAHHNGHQGADGAGTDGQENQSGVNAGAQTHEAVTGGVDHQNAHHGLLDADLAADHALHNGAHSGGGGHDGHQNADLSAVVTQFPQNSGQVLGNTAADGEDAHKGGGLEEPEALQSVLPGRITAAAGLGMAEGHGGFLLAQDQGGENGQNHPQDAHHPVAEPPAHGVQNLGDQIAPDDTADTGARHDDA